tara:strand:+ start:269 stop:484 length:216 start_codon:yes stop_codon:yes gene_type:complete
MKLGTLFLILTFLGTLFFSFLIIRLNGIEVPLDLLFLEINVKLGKIILISFLSGFLVTIFFEILYFYRKKN